jgi:hypothetical protein
VLLMLVGAALLGGLVTHFASRISREQPAAQSQQEIVDALSASLEKVAERELAAGPSLEMESWTLRTATPRAEVVKWLEAALPRVGGNLLPEDGKFLLEFPADARLRLQMALDPIGKLEAPGFEDSTGDSALPDLPVNLPAEGETETVRLEVSG